MELTYATSREAAEALAGKPLAFLPAGALYARGNLPAGIWCALARFTAGKLAEACGGLLLPAVPWSSTPGGDRRPGNVHTAPAALRKYIEAVATECLRGGMLPVAVSAVPGDNGLPYIICREFYERERYPLPWLNVPGLIWRRGERDRPPGDAALADALAAAAAAEWGPEDAERVEQALRNAPRAQSPSPPAWEAVSRTPSPSAPPPLRGDPDRVRGERLVLELCREFSEEFPDAFARYAEWTRNRPSFKHPLEGFPQWAG